MKGSGRGHSTAINAACGSRTTPTKLRIRAAVGAYAYPVPMEAVITCCRLRRSGTRDGEKLLIRCVRGRWLIDAEQEVVSVRRDRQIIPIKYRRR